MKSYKTIETAKKKAQEIVDAEYEQTTCLIEATIHRAEESKAFHTGTKAERMKLRNRFAIRLYSHDVNMIVPYAHQGFPIADRRSDFCIERVIPSQINKFKKLN